jgi:hypothetical protein
MFTHKSLHDGENCLTLKGVDTFGNIQEIPTLYCWIVDLAPPLLSALSHVDDKITNVPSIQVNLTISEPLASLKISLDAQPFRTIDMAPHQTVFANCSINMSLPLTVYVDGLHTLGIVAKDLAGNTYSNSTFHVWELDRLAPVNCGAVITSPRVTGLGASTVVKTPSVAINLSCTDFDVHHFLLSVDEDPKVLFVNQVAKPTTAVVTVTGMPSPLPCNCLLRRFLSCYRVFHVTVLFMFVLRGRCSCNGCKGGG